MSFDEWILALHVLSAFALVGAMIMFWFVYLALRANGDAPAALGRLAKTAGIVIGVGIGGTLVFGLWLAISLDRYQVWDSWVILGLVLWAIATATGQRAGTTSREVGGSRRVLALHAVSSLAVLVVLIDMIWKPGVNVVAAIRPDSWNLPLFLHILGAMILVGGMLTGASALALARGDARLLRLGYWSLLAVGLPGWVVMWVGANWIYAREGLDDEPIASVWVGIGFVVAELGLLLFLSSLVVGGIGVYRLRAGKGTGLLKATMVISIVLLVAYAVAIWAMTAKPD